ncbi:MAG: TonB-dependent receptor [Porphyromonas sp.]|nr:TonB-dependent receptor [Porphyromonas sp.]
MKKLLLACSLISLTTLGYAQESEKGPSQIGEVVVTSTKTSIPLKNIPQRVEIITQEQLASTVAKDLGELLSRFTNLDMIKYPGASASIGMRGFSPTAHARAYTLIMIDGLPSGTTNVSTIPISLIEKVEVIRGPYAVLYGTDAMGGIINIVTKKAIPTAEVGLGLSYGSFKHHTIDAHYAAKYDKLGIVLGLQSDAQKDDYKIGGSHSLALTAGQKATVNKEAYNQSYPHTKIDHLQLMGKLSYDFAENLKAGVTGLLYNADGIDSPGAYPAEYPSLKQAKRSNLQGNVEWTVGANKLSIAPYFAVEKSGYYEKLEGKDNFLNFRDDIRSYGLKLSDNIALRNWDILFGVDYDMYKYASERQEAAGKPIAPYKPDNSSLRFSGYGQVTYVNEGLTINLGARANSMLATTYANKFLENEKKNNSYFYFNPSAGIKYLTNSGLNFHASYGNAFYLPDPLYTSGFYEIKTAWGNYKYVGNPKLKPETSHTFEGGLGFSKGFVNIDLNYFYTLYNGKIIQDTSRTTEYFYINAKGGQMQGVEALASIDFGKLINPLMNLELYAKGTFISQNRVKEGDIWKAALYVANTNYNAGIYFKYGLFSTRINTRYGGSRYEKSFAKHAPEAFIEKDGYVAKDKIIATPPHLVTDLSLRADFNKMIGLQLQVNNLFNENYAFKDQYYMPGRNFMATLRVGLEWRK